MARGARRGDAVGHHVLRPDLLGVVDRLADVLASTPGTSVQEVHHNCLEEESVKKYLQPHMVDSLKDHRLEKLPSTELVQHFKLSAPKGSPQGGLFWVHLMWTPIGVVIGGDLLGRGVIGRLNAQSYGPQWFAEIPSDDYLLSKFLPKVWQRESAAEWCWRHAREIRDGEYDPSGFANQANIGLWRDLRFRKFSSLGDRLQGLEVETCEQFRDELRKIDYDTSGDEAPGTDYPLVDGGWLCAIQHRFSQEWKKLAPAADAAGKVAAQ